MYVFVGTLYNQKWLGRFTLNFAQIPWITSIKVCAQNNPLLLPPPPTIRMVKRLAMFTCTHAIVKEVSVEWKAHDEEHKAQAEHTRCCFISTKVSVGVKELGVSQGKLVDRGREVRVRFPWFRDKREWVGSRKWVLDWDWQTQNQPLPCINFCLWRLTNDGCKGLLSLGSHLSQLH